MFKVLSLYSNTGPETSSPFVDCVIDNKRCFSSSASFTGLWKYRSPVTNYDIEYFLTIFSANHYYY